MLHLSDYIEKYGLRPCYSNKEFINEELVNEKKETEEEKKRIKSIRANLKLLADKKIEEMVKSSKENAKIFTKIKAKKNNKNAIKDDISELIFINDFVDLYFNMVNYRIIIKDLDTDYSSDENDCIYD